MPPDNCPVCNHPQPRPFLNRAGVPVHQNLLFETPAAARAVARGALDMRACGGCGFVFNAAFDPSLLAYGPTYENSQNCSPAFEVYIGDLVEHLIHQHGVRGGRVVEVGCGKGAFLAKLLSHPLNNSTGVGFDPSYLGTDTDLAGRLRFERSFYGPETAVSAEVVVCRHVIEHIPDPLTLLRTIRDATGAANGVRVFFETPCVDWILRRRVPWDLFYEHCSLFTAGSLGLALSRAGFAVSAVRHVFGGQYLWAEAATGEGEWTAGPVEVGHLVRDFADQVQDRIDRWIGLARVLAGRGPVAVWGAGAKGVTFCNLADPTTDLFTGVVDVNPAKQGKYLPGTGHLIQSPERAVETGLAAVLVLNPNYVNEVAGQLARLSSAAIVLDLMYEDDRATSY